MKLDITRFGIRVVLKNTGNNSYIAYPRDIEGTILTVYLDRNIDAKHAWDGNYRILFDISNTVVQVKVRWDNDTKSKHVSSNLYIRDFGRCPGLQSIWSSENYLIDNRPYHTLKPVTHIHTKDYNWRDKYINIDIESIDLSKEFKEFKDTKIKQTRVKNKLNSFAAMYNISNNSSGEVCTKYNSNTYTGKWLNV